MAPTAKAKSFDTALILPALVVCILYVAFLTLRGTPGSADLTLRQRALADAQAAAVSPDEVRRLQQEEGDLKQKLDGARQKLKASRSQAEGLARKQTQPLGRIETVAQIEDLLKRHGIEVTRVKASNDQGDAKLGTSLQKAAAALVNALAKAQVTENQPGVPGGPPPNIQIEAQFEAQAEAARLGIAPGGGGSVANAPPLDLRELELRGEYRDMLLAIEALKSSGGDSVVLGLGFERPASFGGRAPPLVWRMILHVQPGGKSNSSPGDSPTHPTTPAEVPRLASEREREAKVIAPQLERN